MPSTWVSAIAVLLAFVNGVRNQHEALPCTAVQTSSSVVALGSPVTATCVVREDCPQFKGQAVGIQWRLGNRVLPSSRAANGSSWVSTVVIPSFSDTRAYLTCHVRTSPASYFWQVAGGVVIRAGNLPPVPQNLTCQTNLTTPNTLCCRWDPGQEESQLLTKYTLHTVIRDLDENHTYEVPAGVHHYTIPRTDFVLFSEMEISVKAFNELGETFSETNTVEPIRSAKFDPPKILKVQTEPKRYGCLSLSWSLSAHQAWIAVTGLKLEVRLQTTESSDGSEQPIPVTRVMPNRPVEVCRLLHGTEYRAQIKVRYQQSPWSEWSAGHSGVTLERAPTGPLDSWMKVSGEQTQKHFSVHLFWKPSKQFRANSKNVSYTVSVQRLPGDKGQVCSTPGHDCAFRLPKGAKKVFLRAVNAAGRSNPTEVPVLQRKARSVLSDVMVRPYNDSSLLVRWTSLASPGITGYVVERRPSLKEDPSLILFDLAHRNQSSLLITGTFEPYKPYEISVYPKFKDGIGLPLTVTAYSRQKAPAMVPKIRVKETWHSYIELTWDEIPIGLRNGIVQSYKVFYWDTEEHIKVVTADLERRRVLLKDLNTVSLYKAFMMVSTYGGSLNGSMVNLKTEPMDAVAVVMIVIPCCVGLLLLIIITVLTCFSHHKRLKVCFCPMIPDPANSSIKRWTSDTNQDIPPVWETQEPNPVYLSHLSLMDLSRKHNKGGDETWSHNSTEATSDLGESICSSPLTPGCSGTHSESGSYATVIFSSPYTSQQAKRPHAYLRSESTQPLLEAEEPFTPKSYQNMPSDDRMPREQFFFGQFQDGGPGENADSGTLWDDFPLLQTLAINDAQTEI
ncbi:granulocyte colony-stimulating factor receptor [Polymixia lowei]